MTAQTQITPIRAQLRSYWQTAETYQRTLYWLGTGMIIFGLLHILPLVISGGELSGPVSFRKPITFGLSGGLTLISTTWLFSFMPKRRRWGLWLNGILAIMLIGEILLISLQTWRGVPSHFNFSTPLDAAIFSAMGTMISFIAVVVLIQTILSFSSLNGPSHLIWSLRIGMISLLVSQLFGQLIIANGIPKVIDLQTGDFLGVTAGPESPNVFGLEGLMKLPHFLTLHAIQTLPFLALLLNAGSSSKSRKKLLVSLGAVGYTGMVAIVTLQVFLGKSTFDLPIAGWLVLAASSLAIALPFALSWLQRSKHALPTDSTSGARDAEAGL